MRADSWPLRTLGIALGVALVVCGPYDGVAAEPAATQSTSTSGPTRTSLVQSTDQLDARRTSVEEALRTNNLQALKQIHEQVREDLTSMRLAFDEALMKGPWSGAGVKQSGLQAALARVEGIRILNTMCRAILNGYSYPTGKIPASAADATSRMFDQVAMLKKTVHELDAQASTGS